MRTWCDISLDNLEYNLNQIKNIASPDTILCGIVKANAYGHGATEIARNLIDNGFNYLAVAFIDEAVNLRLGGIDDVPILILGYTPKDTINQLIEYNITAAVYDVEIAELISKEAKKQNKIAKIHIKIDTGMSRVGFLPYDNCIEDILEISRLPNLEIEGIFTHFACADTDDTAMTLNQFEKFKGIVDTLEKKGLTIPIKHCCNSAAFIRFPQMHLDMVRIGIILYGMYPSNIEYGIDLKPVMTLKTTVINVKTLQPGDTVSYGATYTVREATRVATIAIGYADGYPRLLSNKSRILVKGQYAKVLGRICMDQCMIDVTNVNNISVGDEVILFGTDNDISLPVEELANFIGSVNYELPCIINNRVPRCYVKNNRRIKIHDNLSTIKSL